MALIGTPDEREGGGETRHTSHISTPTGEHATHTHTERGTGTKPLGIHPHCVTVCVCIPMRVLVGERGVGRVYRINEGNIGVGVASPPLRWCTYTEEGGGSS